MRLEHTSLFNLIEIFRKGKKRIVNSFNTESHCAHKALHDYYCDAEMPFIQEK